MVPSLYNDIGIYDIYYCEMHDQGYLVKRSSPEVILCIDTQVPCCTRSCIGYHGHHGMVEVEKERITTIGTKPEGFYDRYAGHWEVRYFANEIYNDSGKEIKVPILNTYFESDYGNSLLETETSKLFA